VSLKENIERQLQIPTRIRMGAPGSLDIIFEGRKIYSKKQTGRLPSIEEVIALLRNSVSAPRIP